MNKIIADLALNFSIASLLSFIKNKDIKKKINGVDVAMDGIDIFDFLYGL